MATENKKRPRRVLAEDRPSISDVDPAGSTDPNALLRAEIEERLSGLESRVENGMKDLET